MIEKDNWASQGSSFLFTTAATTITTATTAAAIRTYSSRAKKNYLEPPNMWFSP